MPGVRFLAVMAMDLTQYDDNSRDLTYMRSEKYMKEKLEELRYFMSLGIIFLGIITLILKLI